MIPLQAHILRLLRTCNLRGYVSPRIAEWCCFYFARIIVGPKITSELAYAVWLHEIGHIRVGRNEYDAWNWARLNSLVPWSPKMARFETIGLASYHLLNYGDTFPQTVRLPMRFQQPSALHHYLKPLTEV